MNNPLLGSTFDLPAMFEGWRLHFEGDVCPGTAEGSVSSRTYGLHSGVMPDPGVAYLEKG